MQLLQIQSAAAVFNATNVVRASKYQNVMDISFKNIGTADATLTIGGVIIQLPGGGPMKSLGGYPGCIRKDEIPIIFLPGPGTKIVEVYFTLLVIC